MNNFDGTIKQGMDDVQQNEEKLRRAESLYHAVFNQSPDGILIIDLNGNFIEFNEAAHRQLGYTREEFERLRISDVESLHGTEEVRWSIRNIVKNGRAEYETKHKTKENGIRDVKVISQVMDLTGSTVIHTIWRDITERKSAEDSIRKSEAFIKNILESIDEGLIVIDRDFKILLANKAYLAQVNMPLEAVLGKYCYEITHNVSQPCCAIGEDCAMGRTFDTGEPDMAIHTRYDKEGNLVIVEIRSFAIQDEAGNVTAAIEVFNNVTEKKKNEAHIRKSQKMETVGRLAGGIAHDFNNILTAIMGYGSLVKMKMSEDDPLRYNLQQIVDSAERAATLTRGLLAFSKKQLLNPKLTNLNGIVTNNEKLLKRIMGEDVELKVVVSDIDLTVKADSKQIEQVLMNLVTNAKDAMSRGGRLIIRTEPVVLERDFIMEHGYGKLGMYALLTVSDTGIGMDERTKENIFEPLYTTKGSGKGTGLGLAIAYGTVKQHSGYITCSSEPGKGTTFKVYLPMIKGEVAKAADAVLAPVTGGTETVLIAEDDATVRSFIKEMLKQYGYEVIEAVDGEDAITRFKENRDKIQLIILDIVMPKKNGDKAYEEIQKIRPNVKVIFTSGYTADILTRREGLKEAFNFVSKPISPAELLRMVREALDKR